MRSLKIPDKKYQQQVKSKEDKINWLPLGRELDSKVQTQKAGAPQ
jgi:hypothetical protein